MASDAEIANAARKLVEAMEERGLDAFSAAYGFEAEMIDLRRLVRGWRLPAADPVVPAVDPSVVAYSTTFGSLLTLVEVAEAEGPPDVYGIVSETLKHLQAAYAIEPADPAAMRMVRRAASDVFQAIAERVRR